MISRKELVLFGLERCFLSSTVVVVRKYLGWCTAGRKGRNRIVGGIPKLGSALRGLGKPALHIALTLRQYPKKLLGDQSTCG